MARKQLTLQDKQQIVDDWNAKHPIGTAVILRRGNQDFHTRTRSAAELHGTHKIPIIWVEGLSGGYALEQMTAI